MKIGRFQILLIISLVVFCISCKDKSTGVVDPPGPLDDAFSLAAQNQNLRCLIVFQGGRIVKERYFHSSNSQSPHDVRSVTKSVMATLIGIAIDRGTIPSDGNTIGTYLKPLVGSMDSVKAQIKISDVLSMSAGISGNELASPSEYDSWLNASDQLAYTLAKPVTNTPGRVFNYNSGVAHLLSAIITQASGGSTLQFGKQFLFQPLGIANPSWETDKRGLNNGGAGLQLTPYDMLKIGQLYLNKGTYNGTRIISQEWIEKASSFKITTNNAQPFGPGYGYCWWMGNIHSHDYFFANGYGGQFIVVVPDVQMVIVAANNWYGVPASTANTQWNSTLDLIMNKIIALY